MQIEKSLTSTYLTYMLSIKEKKWEHWSHLYWNLAIFFSF